MRSIFVKGEPVDAGLLVGVKQLKEFNHAVQFHNNEFLISHNTLDLTAPNAVSFLDHLVAEVLSDVGIMLGNQKFINVAQTRYLNWKTKGYPKVDVPMIPLLDTIAQTEVLCPMHSCTGHVNEEQNKNSGYVSITGEIHTLLYLEQVLVSLIKQMPEAKWLMLQRSSNVLPLGNNLFELPFIRYPVIVIRWYGKTQELLDARRAQVTALLEEACKDIVTSCNKSMSHNQISSRKKLGLLTIVPKLHVTTKGLLAHLGCHDEELRKTLADLSVNEIISVCYRQDKTLQVNANLQSGDLLVFQANSKLSFNIWFALEKVTSDGWALFIPA